MVCQLGVVDYGFVLVLRAEVEKQLCWNMVTFDVVGDWRMMYQQVAIDVELVRVVRVEMRVSVEWALRRVGVNLLWTRRAMRFYLWGLSFLGKCPCVFPCAKCHAIPRVCNNSFSFDHKFDHVSEAL